MASRRISEDLLVEILKRLPVKSLMRFKTTSKRWCALIKSPYFIKSHLASAPDRLLILNHTRDRHFFLFPDDDDESLAVNINTNGHESVNLNTDGVEPVIDFNQLARSTAGITSCDGIVCLFGGSMHDATPPIIPITLWNPATRKFKSLPIPSYSASIDKIGAKWQVGFGFDSKTDDYKVVANICLWGEGEPFLAALSPWPWWAVSNRHIPIMNYAEIYSLKTNSWRVIDSDAPVFYCATGATYIRGLCYWVTTLGDLREHGYVVVSFDMEDEVFRVTPAPPSKGNPCITGSIELLASSNELVAVMYDNTFSPIEVWAMKDLFAVGGDCWTLKYILEQPAGGPLILKPLGLWKNCLLFIQTNGSIRYRVRMNWGKFCLYNPGTREIRNLKFPGRIFPSWTYGYKETFVSLA